MAAKIAGVLFLVAGYALFRRARTMRRNGQRGALKMQVASAGQILAAFVCFAAAYLCIVSSAAHAW